MFRWIDTNDTGNDHGLAVDDLTIGWASNSTPSIVLAPTPASFGESAGTSASTVNVTISQAAPVGGITIALSSSDLDNSEVSIPANVFIAEGQTTGSFLVGALTDTLVDGSQAVTITASLSGYTSGNTVVTVTDTTPTISLSGTPSSFLETAGASASTVTVTLSQAAPTGGLTLNLSSNDSDNSEITLPATVTVAQGDTMATFTVGALTDSLADSDQLITISATPATPDAPNAPGFAIGTGSVTVLNVDAPAVQFSQYYEGSGTSKVLEITNTTSIPLPLTGYYLALFTNAAAETWKTTATPIASAFSLSTRSIPANGYLLAGNTANGGAGLPTYVTGYNYANGVNFNNNTLVNYNGNDSVVLYLDANANGSLEVSEIVDALSFTNAGNEGSDKTFYRTSPSQGFNLTAGSKITTFPSVWAVKDLTVPATLAEVIAAVPADPFYLQGAVLPITLTPTVSTFAENAAAPASVVTVSVPYNVTANTTVTLAVTVGGSPDTTEITIPADVTILSGTSSITFDVAALTDTTVDGSQIATITATAAGFANGTAALTVTDVDAAGYTSWQGTYFTAPELANPLISGDNADPDGDGLSNALEYAFGTLPNSGTSGAYLPQSTTSGTTLELSYLRPVGGGVPGVTYSVQVLDNTDLVSGNGNWVPAVSPADYTVSTTTVGTPAGTEKVTITFVAPVTAKKFGRIGVAF